MPHELGPLPKPFGWLSDGRPDGLAFAKEAPSGIAAMVCSTAPVFTDHQMRAYALAEVQRAVAAERERSAKVCDAKFDAHASAGFPREASAARALAAAIRKG